jgi:hypothetical protein
MAKGRYSTMKKNTVKTTVRIPLTLFKKMKRIKDKQRITLEGQIELALKDWIKKYEGSK